jgi:hypothetical protein
MTSGRSRDLKHARAWAGCFPRKAAAHAPSSGTFLGAARAANPCSKTSLLAVFLRNHRRAQARSKASARGLRGVSARIEQFFLWERREPLSRLRECLAAPGVTAGTDGAQHHRSKSKASACRPARRCGTNRAALPVGAAGARSRLGECFAAPGVTAGTDSALHPRSSRRRARAGPRNVAAPASSATSSGSGRWREAVARRLAAFAVSTHQRRAFARPDAACEGALVWTSLDECDFPGAAARSRSLEKLRGFRRSHRGR